MGDSCAAPIDIALINGVGSASADRTFAVDDAAGSCGGAAAGDLVFRFTTTAVGALTIDVRPADGQQRLVTYVRSACGSVAAEVPAACAAAASPGGGTLTVLRNLTAGTYYLWVDGATPTAGPVNVSLSFAPDIGDVCTGAIPLSFSNGEVTSAGTTAGAGNEATSGCGGLGPDLVYRFDVPAPSNLEVTLTPRIASVQPVVYLASSSCTASPLACAAATAAGGAASLRTANLLAGTYYLWVDNATANSGPFALVVRLLPPVPGDICSTVRPLVFSGLPDGGGVAREAGDTTSAFNDVVGTCTSGTSGDVVYSFTTSAPFDLRASVASALSTYRPALYLRTGACTGSERACAAASVSGGIASLVASNLAPGSYFLWVDGVGNTSGPFDLSATLMPPLPGETCSNPVALAFSEGRDGGTASATGDTSPFLDDTAGACIASGSPDTVYTFSTGAPLDFRATLAAGNSLHQPALYLRSGCTGTVYACAAAAGDGGSASAAYQGLPAGTYSLFVDGYAGSAGPWSLNAALTPPVPGEGCNSPLPLIFNDGGATVFGDTTSRFDDSIGSCAPGNSPDQLYTLTTTSTLDFTAVVTPSISGYRPALSLRTATCSGVERACGASTDGGPATLSALGLTPGTYYLWVDGAANTAGPYGLTARLSIGPAEQVTAQPVTDVAVPGPMNLRFHVADRWGNLINTDSTTRFTVTATGSAVFASANTGSIVTGAGTNRALVNVSGGVVNLLVTDSVAELVSFAAIDTEGNGLRYPVGSGTYNQTSATQTGMCDLSSATFPFSTGAMPLGSGTLTVSARGDLDTTNEYLSLVIEGTSYGNLFTGSTQCSTTYRSLAVALSQASLQAYLSDGVLNAVLTAGPSVNCGTCQSTAYMNLTFPIGLVGRFL